MIALGVSTNKRYGTLPDTPTFEELGLKPLDFSIWHALMSPAKLPAEIVAKIHAGIQKVLATPDVQARR